MYSILSCDIHSIHLRTALIDTYGTLESQLQEVKVQINCNTTCGFLIYLKLCFSTLHAFDVISCDMKVSTPPQAKSEEITQKKEALRKIEELGAQAEEALIFDNK